MRNWGIKGSYLQCKAKLILLAAVAQAKRSLARHRNSRARDLRSRWSPAAKLPKRRIHTAAPYSINPRGSSLNICVSQIAA